MSVLTRLETYLIPGETLIPWGRGEAFHPGIGYASYLAQSIDAPWSIVFPSSFSSGELWYGMNRIKGGDLFSEAKHIPLLHFITFCIKLVIPPNGLRNDWLQRSNKSKTDRHPSFFTQSLQKSIRAPQSYVLSHSAVNTFQPPSISGQTQYSRGREGKGKGLL